MKKIACLLLLIALVFPKKNCAQVHEKKPQTALKLNIGALADDISFPTIRMALEQVVSPRLSISGELGYQFYSIDGSDADPEFTKEKGIKVNLELRRYARRARHGAAYSPLTGFYTGLNMLYAQNRRNLTAYYYRKDNYEEDADRFYARKTITGLSVVLGYQLLIRHPASLRPGVAKQSQHLLFDFLRKPGTGLPEQ